MIYNREQLKMMNIERESKKSDTRKIHIVVRLYVNIIL